MKIHFLTHHSREAKRWPFYQELVRLGGDDRVAIFADQVELKYRYRIQLALLGWPRLIWSAMRLAKESATADSPAKVVVVHEHLQLLVMLLYGRLLAKLRSQPRPEMVLLGFILTPRSARWLNRIRNKYFSWLFRRTALVICHSDLEMRQLSNQFPHSKSIFAAVHYGIGQHAAMATHAASLDDPGRPLRYAAPLKVFSAGRSSRDYATLIAAVDSMAETVACRIACDQQVSYPGEPPQSCTVLSNCHGPDYARELISCDVVVVPLKNPEISAGQMVALHALACGKVVVVTDTPVTREYFEGLDCVLFVPPGDVSALAKVLHAQLRRADVAQLEANARHCYEELFTETVYAGSVYRTIAQHFSNPATPAPAELTGAGPVGSTL